jgi:ABC-type polysaccharide/polyol phosphate transport system ATPase subunit
MSGRLTFSVATAFQPEVLLMDEWLLAGDHRFIHRASERVASFVAQARVMVLASHSLNIVREFCTKAAYLNAGRLVAYGDVEEIIGEYDRESAAVAAE